MEKTETLFFDETGTPAVSECDGLFVVGGIAIRGDMSLVVNDWKIFLDANELHGKKGRKYSGRQLLDVAQFLCGHKIIPLTTYSYVNEDDLYLLKIKIDQFKKIATQARHKTYKLNMATYMWSMHIALSIGTSIFSLLFHRESTKLVRVSVHRFLSQPELQNIIRSVISNFYTPAQMIKLWKPYIKRYYGHPDIYKFFSNLQLGNYEYIELDWNAQGKLALLADVVIALYRRSLQDDQRAKEAWDVLKICFSKNGGEKIPACMGNNITAQIKEIIRTPWSRFMNS